MLPRLSRMTLIAHLSVGEIGMQTGSNNKESLPTLCLMSLQVLVLLGSTLKGTQKTTCCFCFLEKILYVHGDWTHKKRPYIHYTQLEAAEQFQWTLCRCVALRSFKYHASTSEETFTMMMGVIYRLSHNVFMICGVCCREPTQASGRLSSPSNKGLIVPVRPSC